MRRLLALLTACLLASAALAQPVQVQAKIVRLPTANDAFVLALADAKTLPPHAAPYVRYLWIEPADVHGDAEAAKAVSLGLNIISRATTIIRPEPIGRGQLMLLRVDLRQYAPRAKDLREWLHLWEDFQFAPRFNVLITKGALKFALANFPDFKGKGWVSRWKRHPKTSDWYLSQQVESFVLRDLRNVELIRLTGEHIDPKVFDELAARTGSQAPVVPANYFLARALTTIKDKGLFAIVYGGRYYEFAGIGTKFKKGTDQDNLLAQLGVGNVEKGITADRVFERLRSDLRSATFRSKVTRHQRRIDFLPVLAGRLDVSQRFAAITHDLREQSIDIDVSPVANLLDFKDDAREMIFPRANGTRGYVLFNGQGARQDEVPPDVALDDTIHLAGPRRLQPGLSCIACHEGMGDDGWKVVVNDVKKLLGTVGLNAFGDLGRLNDEIQDTVDRINGLYKGDIEHALTRARDDYSAAVLRTTGPWKASQKGQTDVVQLAATRLVGDVRRYTLETVNARQALVELGVELPDPKADALAVFRTLVPPEVRAAAPIPEIGETIVPEDVRVAGIRAGLAISRTDFDLSFGFLAGRLQRAILALPAKDEGKK